MSWLAIAGVKLYQGTLSKLWPNICVYSPSCSHYMVHAVKNRGLAAGLALGMWRILRCHPFAAGGYDPPPGYEDALRGEEGRAAAGGGRIDGAPSLDRDGYPQ